MVWITTPIIYRQTETKSEKKLGSYSPKLRRASNCLSCQKVVGTVYESPFMAKLLKSENYQDRRFKIPKRVLLTPIKVKDRHSRRTMCTFDLATMPTLIMQVKITCSNLQFLDNQKEIGSTMFTKTL